MNQTALLDDLYQHQGALIQFASRRTSCNDEAQDAVMEALERIAPHLDEVAPGARLSYWYRATLNIILDRARRARIVKFQSIEAGENHDGENHDGDGGEAMQLPSFEPPHFRQIENRILQGRVREAVMSLNDEHREVIVRYYFQEQDLETIEREIGVKLGTIKSRLHRARAVLQRQLGSAL